MPKNPTQPNQVKTPKLRFPGFEGVWEEKKLGEVYSFLKTNSFSRAELSEEGQVVNIHYGDIHKSDKYHFDLQYEKLSYLKTTDVKSDYIQDGDVILADASEDRFDIGKAIEILNIKDKKAVSGLHTFLARPKNIALGFSGFFIRTSWFKRNFYRIATGASVLGISKTEVSKLRISLPELSEQQKIASFLSEIDAWIENLRDQKKSLEFYKKSLMQKIFSQQIRFKDEKGNEFAEWEERRLGNVCNIKKGVQLNRDGLSSDTGFPAINGGIDPSGYTGIFNTEGNTITISEGGNSCGYVNFIKENFWSGGHCYSLLDLKNSDKFFLYQYLKFIQKNIMRLRVGSGLPNIQKKDIERLKLEIPSLPEQQKIAEFLSSVDILLESKQQQITKAEEWKKGLMQGLFV